MINCTVKPSPALSNTEALAEVVGNELRERGAAVEMITSVDLNIAPGVAGDMGDGDEWPSVHGKLLAAEILVIASPTWVGRPSSMAQRVIERMDAMLSENDDQNRPMAYNRVAGVVVTGNEDGAHHVISEITGALIDIGYTVPGQWTYWHLGAWPRPRLSRLRPGTRVVAQVRPRHGRQSVAVAEALAAHPVPAPPD